MDIRTKNELIDYLAQFITPHKLELFDSVLENRTRDVTVVLENIYQPQNASAVVRTCDCLGIQDLHIIENSNAYQINPKVTQGSSKWVTFHRYSKFEDNTAECITRLKKQGYRIIATTPHKEDTTLNELPVHGKMAFLFGQEEPGLSERAISLADEYVKIPMYGFTESFNISVSAGLILYQVTNQLREKGEHWGLSEEEKINLKLTWIRKMLKKYHLLEKEFFVARGL
ncbi:RNA methyltransferase [bacterium]|nr:RNA methyltransferase [bacterium]